MISEQTIDKVKELDLAEVIGKYVTLKKHGASWIGSSPFADEKTPSFHVSPAKGIYKCFSSGKGGRSGIGFVMEHKNMSYPEAIRELASQFDITVEETEETPERKEQLATRDALLKLNMAVKGRYVKNLAALRDKAIDTNYEQVHPALAELTENRRLTDDIIFEFEIGYAPEEWRFIAPLIIDRGLYDQGIELGLIKKGDNGNTYDTFRNRIIFPIHNDRGEIVGFGGRTMEKDTDTAKYINSKESDVYKKDAVLYGLYHAKEAIREKGEAILVEGYLDVIAFHQFGAKNTVGPCGTAFTDGQARLLKRFCSKVILIGDGDNAGKKANMKSVDILLRHNFKVEICPMPDGHDPESFARMFDFIEDKEEQV